MEKLTDMSFKNGFLCVLSLHLKLSSVFPVGLQCFAVKRTKSTLKKNNFFFIEEYVFPSKVIIKATVMLGRHSCVAQCWPFAS